MSAAPHLPGVVAPAAAAAEEASAQQQPTAASLALQWKASFPPPAAPEWGVFAPLRTPRQSYWQTGAPLGGAASLAGTWQLFASRYAAWDFWYFEHDEEGENWAGALHAGGGGRLQLLAQAPSIAGGGSAAGPGGGGGAPHTRGLLPGWPSDAALAEATGIPSAAATAVPDLLVGRLELGNPVGNSTSVCDFKTVTESHVVLGGAFAAAGPTGLDEESAGDNDYIDDDPEPEVTAAAVVGRILTEDDADNIQFSNMVGASHARCTVEIMVRGMQRGSPHLLAYAPPSAQFRSLINRDDKG